MNKFSTCTAVAAGLSLALLSGCGSEGSSSASASASASAPASALSSKATGEGSPVAASELTGFVSDRTFSGKSDGTTYQEYYNADGTISGLQDGEKYTGTWVVQGDKVCVTYEDTGVSASIPADASPSASSSQDCYTINVSGSTAYWYSDGDAAETTTFVEGNPDNL